MNTLPYPPPERKEVLGLLIGYIRSKIEANEPIQLHFICTHNSRRSQFSQFWAKLMAFYHQISCRTFSGGVEVTACNERVIKTLRRQGFTVSNSEGGENPKYRFSLNGKEDILLFSKLVDHPSNPSTGFAAVMTCAHADEHCPFIAGAEQRIPLRYTDPKIFDDTKQETQGYLNKSMEIAAEMFYVFSSIKQQSHE